MPHACKHPIAEPVVLVMPLLTSNIAWYATFESRACRKFYWEYAQLPSALQEEAAKQSSHQDLEHNSERSPTALSALHSNSAEVMHTVRRLLRQFVSLH